ncbi:MAG: tyrosine-type recombinase/integrase [Desulfobulbales bacterium]|nr:tyrosine-type recombinase/integrase [Desulfobulbales bacterium]
MSVKPHPTKGQGWWYIILRPQGRKGKMVYLPFAGTEIEARTWEAEIRKEARGERSLGIAPRINEVLPHFIVSYRLDHQPAGTARTIRSFKKLIPHFGPRPLTAATRTAVEEYKKIRLGEGVKPTTINKELAALSSLLKWAAEQGYCQPIKIKRFPPKLTRAPAPDVPSRIEVLAVLNSADWPKCGLLACLYFGGLRSTEAKSLTAENVRLDMEVMVVIGKGNKQRVVPIVKPLARILAKRIVEVGTGLLWDWTGRGPVKDLRSLLEWSCKRAGVRRRITPHTFRHAFGVHATIAGAGLRGLQQIMGHSTSTITEIYTTLAAENLIKELKNFGK